MASEFSKKSKKKKANTFGRLASSEFEAKSSKERVLAQFELWMKSLAPHEEKKKREKDSDSDFWRQKVPGWLSRAI